MAKQKNKNIILNIIMAISALFLIIFLASFYAIYKDVKTNCINAKKEYKKDCLESLISLVESENKTYRQKNSAIWTLGQLADKKALSFLYQLDKTLPNQEKCNYNKYVCKYEIKKAIKWCQQGNITSWMYKNQKNW